MFQKRLNSFKYAFKGIYTLVATQPNARIHLVATVGVCIAGWFFHISKMEWCAVMLAIAMVFSAEGFNTAIEFLTDLVSPGYHPLAGKAKDVAAGAVLIAALGAIITGFLVFGNKIISFFIE